MSKTCLYFPSPPHLQYNYINCFPSICLDIHEVVYNLCFNYQKLLESSRGKQFIVSVFLFSVFCLPSDVPSFFYYFLFCLENFYRELYSHSVSIRGWWQTLNFLLSQKAFIFPLLLKDFCCGWMTCGGNSSFSALGTVMALSSGFRDVKEAGGHQLRLHFAFPLNPNITTLIKSTTEYSTQQASASHSQPVTCSTIRQGSCWSDFSRLLPCFAYESCSLCSLASASAPTSPGSGCCPIFLNICIY